MDRFLPWHNNSCPWHTALVAGFWVPLYIRNNARFRQLLCSAPLTTDLVRQLDAAWQAIADPDASTEVLLKKSMQLEDFLYEGDLRRRILRQKRGTFQGAASMIEWLYHPERSSGMFTTAAATQAFSHTRHESRVCPACGTTEAAPSSISCAIDLIAAGSWNADTIFTLSQPNLVDLLSELLLRAFVRHQVRRAKKCSSCSGATEVFSSIWFGAEALGSYVSISLSASSARREIRLPSTGTFCMSEREAYYSLCISGDGHWIACYFCPVRATWMLVDDLRPTTRPVKRIRLSSGPVEILVVFWFL